MSSIRFSIPSAASLLLTVFLSVLSAAFSTEALAAGQAEQPSLTAAQARHTLSILRDEKKRTELEQTLETIALAASPAGASSTNGGEPAPEAATPAAAEKGPIEFTQNSLVAQLFDLVRDRFATVGNQLRSAVATLLEIQTVGGWWEYNLVVPERRTIVLVALGEVMVILAGALLADMLTRRLLARPRRLVESHAAASRLSVDRGEGGEGAGVKAGGAKVPGEAAAEVSGTDSAQAPPDSPSEPSPELSPGELPPGVAADGTRARTAVDRHWSLLRRFPYALAHWVLELIPLGMFFGTAILLLQAFGGKETIFYSAMLPIISAYTTSRVALSVVHLMVSPRGQGLRLIHIRDATARFLNRWLRWIIIIAVFGSAFADVAVQVGATRATHDALLKLVGLAVHVMLLIMVMRSRKQAAAAIRGTAADRNGFSGLREVLADAWPFVATFFIVAAWLLWTAGAENGFQDVLRYFALSAAVIVGASLTSIFVLGAIDRAFLADRESLRGIEGAPPQPAQPVVKSTYHLLLHRTVSMLIGAAALIMLLRVWGVDTFSWFEEGSVGRRLASAAVTIAVAVALALLAWEAFNTMLSRRIERWEEGGDHARAARLRTLTPMIRTTLAIVIGAVVLFSALDQLGVSIAPLLAGASIIGVALGFGSQKLVQDFITGLFLLMENAIQVGDFIKVADLMGSVEHLSIRTVRLRAPDGALHLVPFSSVSSVTNTNRGIGNASVKVTVAADSDVDQVFQAIRDIGAELRADPQFSDLILQDVDIWGVDQVDGATITVLGQIRTLDKGRWLVQRGFNLRLLRRFRELGIQFANPQYREVMTQPSAASLASDASTGPDGRTGREEGEKGQQP